MRHAIALAVTLVAFDAPVTAETLTAAKRKHWAPIGERTVKGRETPLQLFAWRPDPTAPQT